MKNNNYFNIKLSAILLFSCIATSAMGDCTTPYANVTIINSTKIDYIIQIPASQQCNCADKLKAWADNKSLPSGGQITGPIFVDDQNQGSYTNSCMAQNNNNSFTYINLTDPSYNNQLVGYTTLQVVGPQLYLAPTAWLNGNFGNGVTISEKMTDPPTVTVNFGSY